MRYKEFKCNPNSVRIGDVILNSFETLDKVQEIRREHGGYSFISNITNLECHLYNLAYFPDTSSVTVRRDALSEILKLL